jgi:hypothetical protein
MLKSVLIVIRRIFKFLFKRRGNIMSEALSITLQNLLEIDRGRGITFKIYVLPDTPDMALVIELRFGDYCYGRAISLMEARATHGELKDYLLGELRRYADELYWKYRTSKKGEQENENQ